MTNECFFGEEEAHCSNRLVSIACQHLAGLKAGSQVMLLQEGAMDLESLFRELLPEYKDWFGRRDLADNPFELALRAAVEKGQTVADVARKLEESAGQVAAFEPLGGLVNPRQLELPFEPKLDRRRPLFKANQVMGLIQRVMLNWFRFRVMGGPYGSVGLNVRRLRGSRVRYIYRVDLANAFGCVPFDRLAKLLWVPDRGSRDYCAPLAREVAGIEQFLRRYCCVPGYSGLVQGGAASPYLFDKYARETLDVSFCNTNGSWWPSGHPELRSLPSWCYRNQLKYLRLADDMLFASLHPIGKHKRAHILKVIRMARFEPSSSKTRRYDLAMGEIVVNGAGFQLQDDGRLRVFMPAERRRKLQGLLHRAMTKGDVPADVVHGHMGYFYELAGKDERRMTAAELKLHLLYQRYLGQRSGE